MRVARAIILAAALALAACASPAQQEDSAIQWANTSHAVGCMMGGLC